MTLKNTTAIILQGPVEYAQEIVNCYSHIKHKVIVSTNLIDKDQKEILEDNGFFVKKAPTPTNEGRYNFNNQVATTYNGMVAAKEMGFEYALKLRSDIMIDSVVGFIDKLDRSSVYFPAIHNYAGNTYFCDWILFGTVDFMLNLWNIPESTSVEGPEIQLTKRFYSLNKSDKNVKFIFPMMHENEFDFICLKNKSTVSNFQNDNNFIYDKKSMASYKEIFYV